MSHHALVPAARRHWPRGIAGALALVWAAGVPHAPPAPPPAGAAGPYPSDWFALQRAYPRDTIPQATYRATVERAAVEWAAARAGRLGTSTAGAAWQPVGPYNIGGRITALAVAPGAGTVYIGAANGGVFKSVNAGVNWTPLTDHFVFSIGALAMHPANPAIVYVGTGESNSSVDSYDGAGVYRTTDGGGSWEHLGLDETRRIGRVAIDPQDPDRVFVAAMGGQFSTGPHRGLYRSTDGGTTWSKVLFVNDSTGVTDVVIHPTHPETVYAATWERIRRPTYRRAYGPGSGIWRSSDHGSTWTRLQTGLPPPSDDVGRIALAIAPSRPTVVYAQIIAGAALGYVGLGLYRTVDGGETWSRRDQSTFSGIFGGFGWYFGDVAVDPVDADKVYAQGVELIRSTNGGQTWTNIRGTAHVDMHGLWIDPANPSRLYLANDGGFYWSTNGAASWNKSVDLPITQFYAGTVDPTNPARLMGGTQDNNTLLTSGPPGGWWPILGGDGFYALFDPVNPNVILAEWQFCSNRTGPRRSTNGGANWTTPTGFSSADRYNWNTPIIMNPRNSNLVLVGSQRVYRSLNNGLAYSPISGDLTTNNTSALVNFSTITTLDISPADTSTYYAGTDDARVWRSTDRGASWTNVSAGLPGRYVSRVTADALEPQTVYVTLSGFNLDETAAHVYRSTNGGDTWTDISGNLPNIPVNDLVVDPEDNQRLYVATDIGVYATRNLGTGWYAVGAGLPLGAVFDLTLHHPSRQLFAATHGRSQWKLDLSQLPVAVEAPLRPRRLALTSPAPNPARGESRFAVELPAAGAVEVAVFDALGRRLRTLFRGSVAAGRHALAWNGADDSGRRVRPGLYFVRAVASGETETRRLIRLD